MFAKKNRLTKTKEIDLVFKRGQSAFCDELGIKVFRKTESRIPRITILVNTKVSKEAVERNQIKRKMRAILKELLVNSEKGVDVVLITKPIIKEKTFSELKEIIEKQLKKLKLM